MQRSIAGASAYWHTADRDHDRAQPNAVFIHGAQLDHSVWTLQAAHFAGHGFNVLVPDLPGHGRSLGPALPSVEAMADWILALLEAAQVERAMLIGHSMGSLIALQAASQAPLRVSGLALLGCAYPMKVSPSLLAMAKTDETAAIGMISRWSHSSHAAAAASAEAGLDASPEARIEARIDTRTAPYLKAIDLMQRIAALNPTQQVLHTDLHACNSYANGLQAAQALRCRTLFITAEDDLMTPPKSVQSLLAALPQASLVQIARCGHDMLAEQPDRVCEALFDFAVSER